MIEIDDERCSGCGSCYDVCPNYVFRMAGKAPDVSYPAQCCECGQCLSICPEEALTSDFMARDELEPLAPITLRWEHLRSLMLARRSVRNFKSQRVPRETIERLLEAATYAGTSSNGQSEDFIVIQDREYLRELERMIAETAWNAGIKFLGKEDSLIVSFLKRKYGPRMIESYRVYHGIIKHRRENGELHGNDRIGGMVFRNAPTVIVVHGERGNALGMANGALAIRNMELLGMTMGLGACWVGFLPGAAEKDRKIREYLKLAGDRAVYGALLVGYAKHTFERKIPRRARAVRWV
jgi:nitroreductase/NAD-dependent dihydropyrimidine dehydrogenase PreA subunit